MEEEIEKGMTPILLEDLGMRYPKEDSKRKERYGLYQCQYCGKEFECVIKNIKSGNTKSCGCQSPKHNNPHGLRYHPLYLRWLNIKSRCYNPLNKDYKHYGEKGINIYPEWKGNFKAFYTWATTNGYSPELSLDRINVNGNYEPDNCRWTTREVQSRNTRDIISTNKSGFRGVCWHKKDKRWQSNIAINNKRIHLGSCQTALEAAKAYETYVRLNNLEHNFTPALTEEEIEEIKKQKENNESTKNKRI